MGNLIYKIKKTSYLDVVIISILVFILYSVSLHIHSFYEEFVGKTETDPLTIKRTDNVEDLQYVCPGDTLFLPRFIETTKQLNVEVERRIIMKTHGRVHTSVVYNLPNVNYTEFQPIRTNVVYKVSVPHLEKGEYVYMPVLNYKVNDYLTIHKPAPEQRFVVHSKENCF